LKSAEQLLIVEMFHCKDFNAKDKCKNPHLICISYDKYDANLNPLFDLLKCDRNLVVWNTATIGLKLSFSEQNILEIIYAHFLL